MNSDGAVFASSKDFWGIDKARGIGDARRLRISAGMVMPEPIKCGLDWLPSLFEIDEMLRGSISFP